VVFPGCTQNVVVVRECKATLLRSLRFSLLLKQCEPAGCMEAGDFFDHLSDCELRRDDPVPWNE
jgi:hypothetical protein